MIINYIRLKKLMSTLSTYEWDVRALNFQEPYIVHVTYSSDGEWCYNIKLQYNVDRGIWE
jgi:hypothetical protein